MSLGSSVVSRFRANVMSIGRFHPQSRPRGAFALRAGAAVALPVVVGTLAGNTLWGMVAALGGLTALYGNGQPYRARAVELALVALAFAMCVGVGHAIGHAWPALIVPMVAIIAMLATWLCNGLRVGPPGAYLFMLACAAASAMPTAGLTALQVALLVLCGGVGAWLLHMPGAVLDRHGPERTAVEMAAEAVRRALAAEPMQRDREIQRASLAMHEAWQALVAWQPRRGGSPALHALRVRNLQWHRLLADMVEGSLDPVVASQRCKALETADDAAFIKAPANLINLPQGRPPRWQLLLAELQPGTPSRAVILRVGAAALLAGVLASFAGMERAYWAIAAAVLMLHTGNDWTQTVQRSLSRLAGTWGGLVLMAGVLWWQPAGLWLAALLFVVQFTVEMLVMRNYALATMFITLAGMTLASGGLPPDNPNAFLLARGLDTLLGCAVALLVLAAMPAPSLRWRLHQAMAGILQASEQLNSHLAWAELTSASARQTRVLLGHHLHALDAAWEQGQRRGDGIALKQAAVVTAVQTLGYRLLAVAWRLEDAPHAPVLARELYGPGGVVHVQAALRILSRYLAPTTGPVVALPAAPAFIDTQLKAVRDALLDQPERC